MSGVVFPSQSALFGLEGAHCADGIAALSVGGTHTGECRLSKEE